MAGFVVPAAASDVAAAEDGGLMLAAGAGGLAAVDRATRAVEGPGGGAPRSAAGRAPRGAARFRAADFTREAKDSRGNVP